MGQVKDSTKELLSLLLWTAGMFTRPTLRNLTDSYETGRTVTGSGARFGTSNDSSSWKSNHCPRYAGYI